MGRGRPSPVRLALAGAVVAAICASLTSAILVIDESTLDRFRFWDVGRWPAAGSTTCSPCSRSRSPASALARLGRSLNALALGDDMRAALGSAPSAPPRRGVAIVLLAGAAVAVAGPIPFVGLAVPHVARLIVADYRWILAYSLVLGPALCCSPTSRDGWSSARASSRWASSPP